MFNPEGGVLFWQPEQQESHVNWSDVNDQTCRQSLWASCLVVCGKHHRKREQRTKGRKEWRAGLSGTKHTQDRNTQEIKRPLRLQTPRTPEPHLCFMEPGPPAMSLLIFRYVYMCAWVHMSADVHGEVYMCSPAHEGQRTTPTGTLQVLFALLFL